MKKRLMRINWYYVGLAVLGFYLVAIVILEITSNPLSRYDVILWGIGLLLLAIVQYVYENQGDKKRKKRKRK